MSKILIDRTGFEGATELASLIERRAIAFELLDALPSSVAEKSPTLVLSAAAEAAMGGPQKLLERARSLRPNRVMVINEAAEAFAIRRELDGKLLRLDLPKEQAHERFARVIMADQVCVGYSNMIAADAATSQLLAMAARVALTDVTVLVNGPTGTGKEVLARYIHDRSNRADKPFVAINCAAIPENMLEAMLFGHEKGAFTGASVANKGIFRAADGGTLLLDEISEMPLGLQSKLLRVLQERCVTPLGVHQEIPVDVRVIATTNRDMQEEVRRNAFREDLFYRLNVFPLETMPLAARPDDILPLSTALLRRHCKDGQDMPWINADAAEVLMGHDWPGNVRELENVIQRALVMHQGGRIMASDIMIDTGRSVSAVRPWALQQALAGDRLREGAA